MAFLKSSRGVTLVEIVIAVLLISVIFLGSTTVYVTALKFFNAVRDKSPQVYGFLAAETVVRKVAVASEAIVNDSGSSNGASTLDADGLNYVTGKQIKIRWDFTLADWTPLNTPSNTADDTWVKYKIIENPGGSGTYRLYTRKDASVTADVTTADEEVDTLLTLGANSVFRLSSPSGNAEGAATTVDVHLETVGGSSSQTVVIHTDTAVGGGAKR